MQIGQIFQEDINRSISGVVKVNQNTTDILVQELDEYVITKDLRKHFATFFTDYANSYDRYYDDIGVWISGFFGSGKSHFLKMLSYILANKEVQGVHTVERFRRKLEDDPKTFELIENATKGCTDTILFNIDLEGSSNKDKTAVLKVFAKMFYNYLGFYGEDLKVAKLEQHIEKQGKTDKFRQIFEDIHGDSWLNARNSYIFFEDDIAKTLQDVLGMSEEASHNWFNGTETAETSIAQLVLEMKEYVDSKPDDFRLVFMADEVGQYVGGDTDLLLNLQSLVEEIGSKCGGKIWVVCTGQEAIDEIIKARENEFSRIQARFKTRLSLTSSSVDEVIQKRILSKKEEVKPMLEDIYAKYDSTLKNLFFFSGALLDIKGYTSEDDYVSDYPFVPYQFIIMQKVFAEIRKHGNSGKHLSGGERSMISGFKEAAQRIQDKDEYTLAPFYLFYDTVHSFLDSTIRRVIERCEKAADNRDGIESRDVNVLKLLYLIRYIDDIPANLDNIVVLMADSILMDKITMRQKVQASLDRLFRQNYIGKTGDTYQFLTDEEQDIQREIYKNTHVDTSSMIKSIAEMIFEDIYQSKKFNYGSYNFPYDAVVDDVLYGSASGGMRLNILTTAADSTKKSEHYLMATSKSQAFIVLGETDYYEVLENAMKITDYVKKRNITQLPISMQLIISKHQDDARKYKTAAREALEKAIDQADFYADGEKLQLNGTNIKTKINQTLEYLVKNVYSKLNLVDRHANSEADISSALRGEHANKVDAEFNSNSGAIKDMCDYLDVQKTFNRTTSMHDIQSRYSAIPYGWRELDIAYVVAMLIYDQNVTIKYGGATIQPENPRLPDMLHKRSEIGKVYISKREKVDEQLIIRGDHILRDYFDISDVPKDEDGLVRFIVEKLTVKRAHYEELRRDYDNNNRRNYPGRVTLAKSIELLDGILSQSKDNVALIKALVSQEDMLLDSKEEMLDVENFFESQRDKFDAAINLEINLRNDLEDIKRNKELNNKLNELRLLITTNFDKQGSATDIYGQIPHLHELTKEIRTGHGLMLSVKREEIRDIADTCIEDIRSKAAENKNDKKKQEIASAIERTVDYYTKTKDGINYIEGITLLEGQIQKMSSFKDNMVAYIEKLSEEEKPSPAQTDLVRENAPDEAQATPMLPKNIKTLHRQIFAPVEILRTQDDIDRYAEKIREKLSEVLQSCDEIVIR